MARAQTFLKILLLLVFIPLCPTSVHAASAPDVRILDTEGNVRTVFTPFSDGNALIGSVAARDLGHDGVAEILVGAGEDSDPNVSVYRQDGSFIGAFPAYDVGYRGGVNVTACDVDDDGGTEIITGAAWNGGSHIRVFNAMGAIEYPGFFAYNESFTGGVNVTCGDINGDGKDEIISGAGPGGGPHVKVFDAVGTLLAESFVDDASDASGVYVSMGDTDSDGVQEILTSRMGYGSPNVTVWSVDPSSRTFTAREMTSGSSDAHTLIAPVGVDANGNIVTATEGYVEPKLSIIASPSSSSYSPFSSDATHGISAAPILKSGSLNGYVVANIAPRMNKDTSAKSILVDISEQRLTAYEHGVPVHTFLVSTAKKGYVTPLGETRVRQKLLYHDYKWTFGIGDPRNYFVPNVKWNLQIYDHIYIHWAYWHNNFGNPMSHGCVNANATNMDWIYEWTDVGTPVNIVE